MKISVLLQSSLLLLCLLAGNARAENSTSFDGFTVHHNAISTADLTPEVARQYRIHRSKFRGMLNVSVIKPVPNTTGVSMDAIVLANAKNIRGQLISVPMRKITEQDAIYYIGEFRIEDQETLNFEIKVKPKGDTRFYTATLSHQFFID